MANMRVLFLTVTIILLSGCTALRDNHSYRFSHCSLDGIDERLKQYKYSSPKSIEQIRALYKVEVQPYENENLKVKWDRFQDSFSAGDCAYSFTTDEKSWASLAGLKGYIIFRDAEAIEVFIVARS